MIRELRKQALVRQRAVSLDVEHPYLSLLALVDVEPLPVGAHFDPVRRAHVLRLARELAFGRDPPKLPRPLLPIRVARIERSIRRDGQIVRLTHSGLMGEDLDRLGLGLDPQDIVPHVIRDKHRALTIETNPIAHALPGQLHEQLPLPRRRHPANCLLLAKIHREDVPVLVAGRPFDSLGEFANLRQGLRHPEKFSGLP